MKKHYTLSCNCEYDFIILAINSHCKAYKLSWILNNKIGLNLEITNGHKITEELVFTRYKSESVNGNIINLISNRSRKGHMISSQKSINYFLSINKDYWMFEKYEILSKLRKINDILLVFELDLYKEKKSDRFIIYDKKN